MLDKFKINANSKNIFTCISYYLLYFLTDTLKLFWDNLINFEDFILCSLHDFIKQSFVNIKNSYKIFISSAGICIKLVNYTYNIVLKNIYVTEIIPNNIDTVNNKLNIILDTAFIKNNEELINILKKDSYINDYFNKLNIESKITCKPETIKYFFLRHINLLIYIKNNPTLLDDYSKNNEILHIKYKLNDGNKISHLFKNLIKSIILFIKHVLDYDYIYIYIKQNKTTSAYLYFICMFILKSIKTIIVILFVNIIILLSIIFPVIILTILLSFLFIIFIILSLLFIIASLIITLFVYLCYIICYCIVIILSMLFITCYLILFIVFYLIRILLFNILNLIVII